ncbi:MAG: RMD1 family protein [Crocinitomicaceae bacterium]|nr:RMD1 family protein [Crocinitomicaceae bacterium]
MLVLRSTAFHLGVNISISKAIHDLDFQLSKTEDEFALFELGENSWIYLKNYGSVVFINVSKELIQKTMKFFLKDLRDLENLPSDDFEIQVEAGSAMSVQHGIVKIPEISNDIAHIIAINMAQTVALDDFTLRAESLLEKTSSYSAGLIKTGHLHSSRMNIRKLMGNTLILKNRVAENLYIFDTPDIAWDDKHLVELYDSMRKDLDFDRRHQGLQLNLAIAKENLDLYQNILQHRHSSILEWIIILLILFEVIQVLF